MTFFKYLIILLFPYTCISQDISYNDILRELQNKNYKKAISLCNLKISSNPNDAKLNAYLSYCYFISSEHRIVDVDKEALRKRGITKGQTYLFKENDDIKDFLTVRIVYNFDTLALAEHAMLKAIQLQNKNLEYQISLTQIYFAYADHQKLMILLDSISNRFPLPSTANSLNKFGLNYFGHKNYDKALDVYRLINTKFKIYAPAFSNAGSVFLFQGKTDSAIKYLKEANRLNPDDSLNCQSLAQIYIFLQKFDSAAIYKEILYQRDTNSIDIILDLAFLKLSFNKKDAIKMYEKFLNRIKGKPEYNKWIQIATELISDIKKRTYDINSYLTLAEELNKRGFINYAFILLTDLLKIDPANNPAYFELSILYRDVNMPEKSIEFLTKSEELLSDLSQIREVLTMIYTEKAKTYLLMNDFANVLKYAKLCLEKYKKNTSEIHYLLGVAYQKFNDVDAFVHEFEEAIRINDNPKIVEQAKIELNGLEIK